MGAILAIRLTETLTMELHTPIHRIIMWSDSAIVLQWIGRSSSGYHAFAGNRINEIDDGLTRLREKLQTKKAFFRYVPTDLNPPRQRWPSAVGRVEDQARNLHTTSK